MHIIETWYFAFGHEILLKKIPGDDKLLYSYLRKDQIIAVNMTSVARPGPINEFTRYSNKYSSFFYPIIQEKVTYYS